MKNTFFSLTLFTAFTFSLLCATEYRDTEDAIDGSTRQTELYRAAKIGDINWAKRLLAKGHDINERNDFKDKNADHSSEWGYDWDYPAWGHTPLTGAIKSDRTDMVEFLLKNGANPNLGEKKPLELAINKKNQLNGMTVYDFNQKIIKLLFEHNATAGFFEAFSTLASHQYAKKQSSAQVKEDTIFQMFVEHATKPTLFNTTKALNYILPQMPYNETQYILRYLKQQQIPIAKHLTVATFYSMFRYKDYTKSEISALFTSLTEGGFDINTQDENGDTILHMLKQQEKLLIEQKARLKHDPQSDRILLEKKLNGVKQQLAFIQKRIKHIIKMGVNPHIKNKKGESAL